MRLSNRQKRDLYLADIISVKATMRILQRIVFVYEREYKKLKKICKKEVNK